MNLLTIKILSLLIGLSAIGTCLKFAFDERLEMGHFKENKCIEITHVKESDSINQNIKYEGNRISGKNFLLEQNIILYY